MRKGRKEWSTKNQEENNFMHFMYHFWYKNQMASLSLLQIGVTSNSPFPNFCLNCKKVLSKANNGLKAITQLLSRLNICWLQTEWHSWNFIYIYKNTYVSMNMNLLKRQLCLCDTTCLWWRWMAINKKGSLPCSSTKGTQGKELSFELAQSQS